MRFFLDENFPKAAAGLLSARGHEAYDPRGTELQGADDHAMVVEAKRLGAIILTTDRDYFHTLRHTFPEHAGLVVIAVKQPNRATLLAKLEWLLDHVDESDLRDRAFQLRDNSWVAQPPILKPPADN